jgi:hypothetical protein
MWLVAIVRGGDPFWLVIAAAWTLRIAIFDWWRPGPLETSPWLRSQMPSKDPDDYRPTPLLERRRRRHRGR